MIVKAINDDGSSKMVEIIEQMDAFDVCIILADRNHKTLEPNWTLVERLEEFEIGTDNFMRLYN